MKKRKRPWLLDMEESESAPQAGDILVRVGPDGKLWPRVRSWFRVTHARPVESRVAPNRWALEREPVQIGTQPEPGCEFIGWGPNTEGDK